MTAAQPPVQTGGFGAAVGAAYRAQPSVWWRTEKCRYVALPTAGQPAVRRDQPMHDKNGASPRTVPRTGKIAREVKPAAGQTGRSVRPQDIDGEKGGHGPLLRFKRLLEPGRARTLAPAHWRGGDCGHKHDPGDGPIRQSDHSRRQAPTMALRGLAGRSRVHVIPCWLHGPAFAGASWACQRCGSRRVAGKLALPSPLG